MGHIFSKKPRSKITEQDKAVLKLKQQRDKLKQYQKRIEASLESDRQLAKRLISDGMKERAKTLLRKKRFQEQLLKRTDDQLVNLEQLTQDIEFAQVEVKVVDGLRTGNDALKKVNDTLNISDIERILDETREGVEKQQEIDALLFGVLNEDDEEAVLRELNEIITETLPDVPETEIIGEPNNIVEEDKIERLKQIGRGKLDKKEAKVEKVALEA
ncbi:PREDICTED: charged multivesicular body protein 6-A [Nicrophorus vespilloides]|uniref:Charged multivesicular body protein 6-A n=1 Tax=Nicrophorus vespilloides TaxID=110193 RepID=A0ABM1MJ67_NICVS|nr:PREDICTED: charged multivesicular body protein 6-A [Nicrophorus vespilloides]